MGCLGSKPRHVPPAPPLYGPPAPPPYRPPDTEEAVTLHPDGSRTITVTKTYPDGRKEVITTIINDGAENPNVAGDGRPTDDYGPTPALFRSLAPSPRDKTMHRCRIGAAAAAKRCHAVKVRSISQVPKKVDAASLSIERSGTCVSMSSALDNIVEGLRRSTAAVSVTKLANGKSEPCAKNASPGKKARVPLNSFLESMTRHPEEYVQQEPLKKDVVASSSSVANDEEKLLSDITTRLDQEVLPALANAFRFFITYDKPGMLYGDDDTAIHNSFHGSGDNNVSYRRAGQRLAADIRGPHLFAGPKGTLVSLHFDRFENGGQDRYTFETDPGRDNVFLQLVGRKLWILFPPIADAEEERRVFYPFRGGGWDGSHPHVSEIRTLVAEAVAGDARKEAELKKRFPHFAPAFESRREVILGAGEALRVPARWWHTTLSLEAGVAVNWWFSLVEQHTLLEEPQ